MLKFMKFGMNYRQSPKKRKVAFYSQFAVQSNFTAQGIANPMNERFRFGNVFAVFCGDFQFNDFTRAILRMRRIVNVYDVERFLMFLQGKTTLP